MGILNNNKVCLKKIHLSFILSSTLFFIYTMLKLYTMSWYKTKHGVSS